MTMMVLLAPQSIAKTRATGKRNEKRQIESLEQQWRVAQLSGDVVTMDKLLSEDYVGITMTGQVNTKEQQLERVKNRSLLVTAITLSDVRIKLVGPVAIVTSLAEIDGTNNGESIQGTYRYTRIYQHLNTGAWKITHFEATRVPKGRAAAV